jgi:aspartate aminotransferase
MENPEPTLAAIDSMLTEYKRRRAWLVPELNKVSGFKCEMPDGAFYAFVDVRELIGGEISSSADVADKLLNDCHVVVTDGAGFGADGFLRMSYATSMENLNKAVDAMKNTFGSEGTAAA